LKVEKLDFAIYKSKAVGKPPMLYGTGAFFSIADAVRVFNPKANLPYIAPMTPERVLMALYS